MKHKFARVQLAIHELFILNLLLIAAIVAINLLINHYFSIARFNSDLLLPIYQSETLHPKVVERRTFLSCSIAVFLFSLCFIKLKRINYNQPSNIIQILYSSIIPTLVGIILVMTIPKTLAPWMAVFSIYIYGLISSLFLFSPIVGHEIVEMLLIKFIR